MSGLLSSVESAKALGVSATTISRLVNAGLLRPVRVRETDGARWFSRGDVESLPVRLREGHGPECGFAVAPFTRGSNECDCVACHCRDHLPGGELGVCRRCLRPLIVDGRVIRLAPLEQAS